MQFAFFLLYEAVILQGTDAFTYYSVRYDRIWYRYCFERFSWYAEMILIYTYIILYMYYILPKLYVNMHRFFNTSEYLPSIYTYVYAQKEWNNYLHSLLITFGYIVCVHSTIECIFLLNCLRRLYCVPYAKITKRTQKKRK